jgi:hypothetical protein
MISIEVLLLIIWIHFVADFLLQNDKMAINKSSSSYWLTIHSLIYSVPFIIFGFKSVVVIFVSHWFVDFFTSRWTTKLWLKQKRHWFFAVIGLDQAVHLTFLILIIKYFE